MNNTRKFVTLFIILCISVSVLAPITEVSASYFNRHEFSLTLKSGEEECIYLNNKYAYNPNRFTKTSSSNPKVAMVTESGEVYAFMPGTTTVTIWKGNEKSVGTIKVEGESGEFTKNSITTYTDEEFTLKLKNPKKDYTYALLDYYSDGLTKTGNSYGDYYSSDEICNELSVQINEPGTYFLFVRFFDSNHEEISACCEVTVLAGGLTKNYDSVAVGQTIPLPIGNAVIENVEIQKPYQEVTELHELAVASRERAISEATAQYSAECETRAADYAEKQITDKAKTAAKTECQSLYDELKAQAQEEANGNSSKSNNIFRQLEREVYAPYYETKYAECYARIKEESYQEIYEERYNRYLNSTILEPANELYRQYFGKENAEKYFNIYEEEYYEAVIRKWLRALNLPMYLEVEDLVEGKVKLTKDNQIKGVEPGFVVAKVTYTRNKVTQTVEILINVTNATCAGITDTKLDVDGEYYPEFGQPGIFSKIEITTSNKEVVKVVRETEYSPAHIKAIGAGSAKITVSIDGIKVTQTVKVKEPPAYIEETISINIGSTIRYEDTIATDITKVDGNLLTKGAKKSIKPNGIASGSKVTYTSSNKKVATVNSKGTVTAKGLGGCCITVKVDGKVYKYVSITVGNKDGINAVTTGTKYLGTPYSQDYRMSNGYFDCSSFAWRTYREAGKYIGGQTSYAPTAAELARYYAENDAVVSYGAAAAADLLPGDLIFYSFKYNDRYRNISHVAVYYGSNYEKLSSGNGVHDTGKLIHSVGRGVVFENYERYSSSSIVMIVRPSKVK